MPAFEAFGRASRPKTRKGTPPAIATLYEEAFEGVREGVEVGRAFAGFAEGNESSSERAATEGSAGVWRVSGVSCEGVEGGAAMIENLTSSQGARRRLVGSSSVQVCLASRHMLEMAKAASIRIITISAGPHISSRSSVLTLSSSSLIILHRKFQKKERQGLSTCRSRRYAHDDQRRLCRRVPRHSRPGRLIQGLLYILRRRQSQSLWVLSQLSRHLERQIRVRCLPRDANGDDGVHGRMTNLDGQRISFRCW